MFSKQSKEGLLYWKHSNAVGNGRAYDTVHRKILAEEKLTNRKLFAKISSPIFPDTPKMHFAYALTVAYLPIFFLPIAFTCIICQIFPRQISPRLIFPVYGNS